MNGSLHPFSRRAIGLHREVGAAVLPISFDAARAGRFAEFTLSLLFTLYSLLFTLRLTTNLVVILSEAKDLCITSTATKAPTASIKTNFQFRDVLGFFIARAMTHSTNPGHN
jgi:hypothetical protein